MWEQMETLQDIAPFLQGQPRHMQAPGMVICHVSILIFSKKGKASSPRLNIP